MTVVLLDLAGLKCPLPALKTRKALANLCAGDQLEVVCTDPMAAIDIPHLVNALGHRLLTSEATGGRLTFKIGLESI